MKPECAYIALGANLGDARAALSWAWAQLQRLGPARASSLYRTAPIDAQGPDFLNAVVELHIDWAPQTLLTHLLHLEAEQGRERPFRHAPRTLDLDLLAVGQQTVVTPSLQLPHPRLHLRAFVLQPLLELAPALTLPGIGRVAAYSADVAEQAIECLGPFTAPD
ncbi:2-amino-4-hydroxy-6-hydroxymethyldihydropteridine diphosphokinase [Inhella gelatinilytica]|uniref:2-amino-4-hydroxy-6-hydroxymethyldihydropteridine pyrophosphokinase n=1 Tax=Inhella gelatinilytica TaxID=2795030 RepID=A0A931IXI4_9BURK|nr:2-amino-4-hydroxy-6-hydroxymethyldihydropteridine diphosphokinase [Inhella gelatinilytica]MBH9552840.1 2-amino-4-hydroxy-6-hydroxymethyldihydropteridine diphosphokinase [Inhella gelatinilytica]